jgi:hypothetical protein
MSLRLIKHHTMKTYGGVEKEFYTFLTSALNWDKRSGTCPLRYTSGKEAQIFIRQETGRTQISYGPGGEAKNLCSCRELKVGRPPLSQSVRVYWPNTLDVSHQIYDQGIYPRGKSLRYPLVLGRVGPIAGVVVKERWPSQSPVTYLTALFRVTVLIHAGLSIYI